MIEVLATTVTTRSAFKNEKDSYRAVKRFFIEEGFKAYMTILRGFPDYVVGEFKLPGLEPGFMEVKYEDRPLRESQIAVAKVLRKIAPYYVLRVRKDGRLDLYRLK